MPNIDQGPIYPYVQPVTFVAFFEAGMNYRITGSLLVNSFDYLWSYQFDELFSMWAYGSLLCLQWVSKQCLGEWFHVKAKEKKDFTH